MNFQRASLRDIRKYLNELAHSLKTKFQAESISIYTYDVKSRTFFRLFFIGDSHYLKGMKILRLGEVLPSSVLTRRRAFLISSQKNYKILYKIPGTLIAIPTRLNNSLSGLLVVHFLRKEFRRDELSTINKECQLISICMHSFEVLRSMGEEIAGLRMVDEINKIVATELNSERLYRKFYEQVRRIVKIRNLRIDIFEPERDRVKPVFFVQNGKQNDDHPPTQINNSVIIAEVFKKRRIMLTSEYNRLLKKSVRLRAHPDMQVKSYIALPLIVRDNFLGVMICWDRNKKNVFTKKIVQLLKLMAGQSAIAIYNARLFEQLNKAINDLTLLYQIEYHISSILGIEELLNTAVSLIDSALGNLITTIFIIDEKNGKLVIKAMTPKVKIEPNFEDVPLYRGIVGEALKTKKLIYVPEVDKDNRYVSAIKDVKSELAIPLIAGTKILGAIDFQSKVKDRFDIMTIDLLDDIARRIAVFLENAILYEKIEKSYAETIKALVLAMEAKDAYTRGHSERVTELAIKLAERLNFTDGKKKILYWAGLLHDIGKIGISETILNKPGQLDEFEFFEIKRHPVEGARMLEQIEGLKEVVPIIKHHHENIDGTGYPDGLKGEEIPLESRILAVCDVYDAMTTLRSYRKPFSKEGTLSAIKSFSGTRLDPSIVKEFLKMLEDGSEERREK